MEVCVVLILKLCLGLIFIEMGLDSYLPVEIRLTASNKRFLGFINKIALTHKLYERLQTS